MSKPKLSKEELRSRLENREGRYLYQVDQLTSPAYTQDIFDYVISHELNGELKNIKKAAERVPTYSIEQKLIQTRIAIGVRSILFRICLSNRGRAMLKTRFLET